MKTKAISWILIACIVFSVIGFTPGEASASTGGVSEWKGPLYSKRNFAAEVTDLGEGHDGIQVVKLDVTANAIGDSIIVYLEEGDDGRRPDFSFLDMTISFRFKPEGFFDVKNGSPWSYEEQVFYEPGTKYHFKMVIDFNRKKHSIWITPEGGNSVLIADDYDFRVNTTANNLGQLMLYSAADDNLTVTNHRIIRKDAFDAAILAVNEAATPEEMRTAIEAPQLSLSLDLYDKLGENNKLALGQILLDNRGNGYGDDLILQAELDKAVLASDTQAPTDPTELTVTPNLSLQVMLKWEGATDIGGTGVKYYNVYRDDELIASTPLTTYVDSKDILAGGQYTYKVTAVDYAGNESPGNLMAIATVSPESRYFPFEQANIDSAVEQPLTAYARTPDGVFEWHPQSMDSAGALHYLTVATQYDPELRASNGKKIRDVVLDHIRHTISGGREPGFCGNGLNGVGYNPLVQALALAKETPAIWDELTAEEKDKITLMMQAALIGAHWAYDDENNFATGLDQLGNFGKLRGGSYRNGGIGPAVAAIYYIGAEESNQFILNFDYDDFMAKLTAAGFTNIIEAFRPTGKTILEENCHNTGAFTYNGYSTAELHKWIELIMLDTFILPVSPKGGTGSTMGFLVSGVEDLPNIGLLGMGVEFDANDAGGSRSSLIYVSRGWTNAMRNLYTTQFYGGIDLLSPDEQRTMMQRVDVGTTDMLYKGIHGYNDYQKGLDRGVQYLTNDVKIHWASDLWHGMINNPTDAVEAVNMAADTSMMMAAVTSESLNLILAGYNDLSASAQLEVAQALLDQRPADGYVNKEAIQDFIYEEAKLQGFIALNKADTVADMIAAIESKALNLYIPSYHMMNHPEKREAVAQALLEQRPEGGYDSKRVLMDLIEQALIPTGNQLMNLQPIQDGQPRIDVADYDLWPEEHGEVAVALWNDDKTGAISFAIDRNYENEIARAKSLFEQYGFPLTWFVVTNKIMDPSKWEALIAEGYDIQSGTKSLISDITNSPYEVIHEEYSGANQVINALEGGRAKTVSYPNGYDNQVIASQYYIAGRGNVGLSNRAGHVNYMKTNGVGLSPTIRLRATTANENSVEAMVKTVFDPDYKVWNESYHRGWSVMYTVHSLDRSENNAYEGKSMRTEEVIRFMLDTIKEQEDKIWVGSFTDVAMYGQERDTAEVNMLQADNGQITFDLTDRMKDEFFDYPLTLKVRVDNDWDNVIALQDGIEVPIETVIRDNDKYALIKAVPDRGNITLYPVSIEAVNQAMTIREMQHAISDPRLALDLTKYNTLSEDDRAAIAERLITLRPKNGYPGRDSVKIALQDALSTFHINLANTAEEMKSALESDLSDFNLRAYESLPPAEQNRAAQQLLNGRPAKGFMDRAIVQNTLDLVVRCLTMQAHWIMNVADTYIAKANPDNNYGSASTLQTAAYDGGLARAIYVRFDLVSLGLHPEAVEEAAIEVYWSSPGEPTNGKLYIHEIYDDSWEEHTLTWNNAMNYAVNTEKLNSIYWALNRTYSTADLTDFVKDKLSKGEERFSFTLRHTGGPTVNTLGRPSEYAMKMVIASRVMTPLEGINCASAPSEVKAVIGLFDAGDLDLSSYDALSPAEKDGIAQKLLNDRPAEGYADIEALQAALDAVMEDETPSVTSSSAIDMIFALESISLAGSSQIIGNAGTNATTPGSVDFAWSTGIEGDLWIGSEGDWEEVVTGARPDPGENVAGEITPFPSVREYPLPRFPDFPDPEDKGDLDAGWWPEGPYIIEESGAYGNINVKNELTINVGEEDIEIVADNLSVTGSGHILVNRTGGGRLILYVANGLELAGSGKINPEGEYDDVWLYYAGNEALAFGGSTIFNGSLFAEKADVTLGGSGGMTGHIVTGGDLVNLFGNAQADARVIYAPNAVLTVTGSGGIRGAVAVRRLELSGSARIVYDDSMDLEFMEQLDW